MEGFSSNLTQMFTPTEQCAEPILPLYQLCQGHWWGYESHSAIVLVLYESLNTLFQFVCCFCFAFFIASIIMIRLSVSREWVHFVMLKSVTRSGSTPGYACARRPCPLCNVRICLSPGVDLRPDMCVLAAPVHNVMLESVCHQE